jgi:uncharacterized protein (TIGR02145 family)
MYFQVLFFVLLFLFISPAHAQQSAFEYGISLKPSLTFFQVGNESPASGSSTSTHNSFTDPRDGKTYPLIQIDTLWWFNENLDFETVASHSIDEHFGNGVKGRLYSYRESKTVCPEGWRLPTVKEFDQLFSKVAGENHSMVEELPFNWGNINSANPSGFHFQQTGMTNRKKFRSEESFNLWLEDHIPEEAHHVHMYDVTRKDDSDKLTLFRHTHEEHNPIRKKRKLAVRCVCEVE